jgi:hypothetical protein
LHVSVQTFHREAQNFQEAQQAPQRGDGVHEDDHQTGLLRQDVVQKRVALILRRRGSWQRRTETFWKKMSIRRERGQRIVRPEMYTETCAETYSKKIQGKTKRSEG